MKKLAFILNELIENSSLAYHYKKTHTSSEDVVYQFQTSNYHYIVSIIFHDNKDQKEAIVSFMTKEKHLDATNEGNALKVVNTIADIIKSFWREYGKKMKINYLSIGSSDPRRMKLYKKVLTKKFPKTKIIGTKEIRIYPQ